jgi:hypothetical protein
MTAQYRALMLREESRTELEKAMDVYEKLHGFRPTYSTFITLLAHQYIFENVEKAHGEGNR